MMVVVVVLVVVVVAVFEAFYRLRMTFSGKLCYFAFKTSFFSAIFPLLLLFLQDIE